MMLSLLTLAAACSAFSSADTDAQAALAFALAIEQSHDQASEPIAVSVGVPAIEGGIREDWYATLGYARGVHWFAPEGGKMFYAGTSKPKRVMVDCESGKCRFSFFPPAITAAPCPPSK